MELLLNPELQLKVDRAAAENESNAVDYVSQLVERYVDHDLWFRQGVRKGIAQLDRGEFVSNEDVAARVAKLFQQ